MSLLIGCFIGIVGLDVFFLGSSRWDLQKR